ncbi:MAG: SMP-30/gluconolactonase/LRE family protein [Chloroflexales bacterium]|nr:SMP-30/gluconolactonase/LRE family protein [Chloroflexales bacterium]
MQAARLPGPPELLPNLPNAVIDLQTEAGVALVKGQWRYSDTQVTEIDFVAVGPDLAPSGAPNRTYDILPHAEGVDFDDSVWAALLPADTEKRLSTGRVCFNWYRINVTIPAKVGDFDPAGATVVFEVVIDDYAEVWVNGKLPLALGQTGGQVAGGFNTPNRVILGENVQPGQQFQIAVFGVNGPISASPRNYIWMRTATLDFYAADRASVGREASVKINRSAPKLDVLVSPQAKLEQIAEGFVFTEGPVWVQKEGALLFSSPNTNTIYRWRPEGKIEVFRAKSGYSGTNIGEYTQPGSNGLTFSPDGLLTICQHGNRRVIRVNPHGDIAVLADTYQGMRLNSPNDLVYKSDGALYFTDPPFGLPRMFDDPRKETPFSGVYRVKDGAITLLDDTLNGPNGIAFSPDEKYLYVGNWDMAAKVVKRYDVQEDGSVTNGKIFFDMTNAPGADAIDGIKVDQAGNLYVCGPGGIWIISAEGEQLGLIELPEDPHNLAWGDADGQALYITALTSIYRIRLNIAGVHP